MIIPFENDITRFYANLRRRCGFFGAIWIRCRPNEHALSNAESESFLESSVTIYLKFGQARRVRPARKIDARYTGSLARIGSIVQGLDIVRGVDETFGRLTWPDIRELEVPTPVHEVLYAALLPQERKARS